MRRKTGLEIEINWSNHIDIGDDKTDRIETHSLKFWWEKNFYRTDRDLSIIRQRRLMNAFAAITFKQKWMIPLCFPNHLASD
jgi:hypothetical protein